MDSSPAPAGVRVTVRQRAMPHPCTTVGLRLGLGRCARPSTLPTAAAVDGVAPRELTAAAQSTAFLHADVVGLPVRREAVRVAVGLDATAPSDGFLAREALEQRGIRGRVGEEAP